MHIIWLLLLMPVTADETVTVFPGSFHTRESCMQMAEVLITRRGYRCTASEQPLALAGLDRPIAVEGLDPYVRVSLDRVAPNEG